MKRSLAALSVLVAGLLAMSAAPDAGAVALPPSSGCVSPILKTVKKGNRTFRASRWFTRRLHRQGCLARGNPRKFEAFSARCRTKAASVDAYLDALQRDFSRRLGGRLEANQLRLLRLDRREIALLNQRRTVNRRLRSAGRAGRGALQRRLRRISSELVTVRTRRARINYYMNTRAITRRGAAGVWLAYLDGMVQGCLKPFRESPYLSVMREHFPVQLAAAQQVSPPPTRARVATWSNLFSGRALSPTGES